MPRRIFGASVAAFVSLLMALKAHAANTGIVPSHIPFDNHLSSLLILGLLLGAMTTAVCYLFFIWRVFKNLSQLLLIFMLVLLIGHMLLSHDLTLEIFGLDSGQAALPALIRNVILMAFLLACAAFTIDFLDLESHLPRLRLALFSFMMLQVVGMAMGMILLKDYSRFLAFWLAPTSLGVLILAGIYSTKRCVPGGITQTLVFIIFLIGMMSHQIQNMTIINLPSAFESLLFDNLLYCAGALAGMVFVAVITRQFTEAQEVKERMLQQSNERFTLAAQAANEGLYDWYLAGGRVYFSDRLKRLVGRNLRADGKGVKSLWRMIDAPDRAKLTHSFRAFRRSSRNTLHVEFRVNRPDGNPAWIFASVVAVRSTHSGKIIRLVGSFGDVTAKMRSESALRLSEARFRSITEAHPVPVLIVKLRDARIVYASPGAVPLMGVSQDNMTSATLHEFLDNSATALLDKIAASRIMDMEEAILRHPDGSTIPIAVSARLIDYQGEAAAVMGLYDLSERRQAEAQIARQRDALQQSEKMAALGGLLAGVAHELNNPLSVIVGQATLLREGSKEPKTISRSDKIFTAAERCARIVKSFLAIARRKAPEHKLMQINESVAQALELLAYLLRTEDVQLHLELDAALPDIIGDQDQFTQVISNLVMNAAQAMQGWKGKRDLIIRSSADADSKQVRLEVCDTGPGIPQEVRGKIFEPFFTTKAPGSGTGVGLSLCLNIVVAHGGQIALQETPGGGASFIITMPIPEKPSAAVAIANAAPMTIPEKLRILIVDDEFDLMQTLADMMGEGGHSFEFAVNGQIAIEKLQQQEFDIILSDLRMPVMDGPAMYKVICAQYPRYRSRIIFLTGDTLTSFVHDFLTGNPVRFIEKPYTMADINRAITEQLKEAAEQGNITSLSA